MTKNNPNLSDQQKKVLFEEATEAPGSSELNFEKRKASLSIKLLEEIMNAKAIKEHSSPLSGKNLPFSSLSEQLDDKKNKKDTE